MKESGKEREREGEGEIFLTVHGIEKILAAEDSKIFVESGDVDAKVF